MSTGAERICVIGAGPSGITAAKNLIDAGFANTVVYDRGDRVGGNWVFDAASGHSSVFETTHIISSRRYSEYADYPMAKEGPDYPGHADLAAYFQAYARHFRVDEHCRFSHSVIRCEPTGGVDSRGGGFDITVRDDLSGELHTEHYDRLVVANGHHWKPRWPETPGDFAGERIHSHTFKRAAPFAGKRVLVIGGGNSACDVAVETSRVAARVDLSWRRGYWIVPKFVFGQPSDHLHHRIHNLVGGWVPLRMRMRGLELVLKLVNGNNAAYGLPDPDHRFGETHPTVNSELLYFLRHGKIHPRADLERFEGSTVHFVDGQQADYDVIIACTGYHIAHPFLPAAVANYESGPVPLYLRMIHPTRDDLAFVGLFQPLGCIWPGAELQSKILARWWTGAWSPPADRPAAIADELARPHLHQVASPRHTITVDEPTFRARLKKELPAQHLSHDAVPWAGSRSAQPAAK